MRIVAVILLLLGSGVVVGETLVRPPLKCYAELLFNREAKQPNRYCEWPRDRLEELLAGLEFEEPVLKRQVAVLEAEFQDQMMRLTERDRVRRADGMVEEPAELREARLSLAHTLAEQDLIARALKIQTLPVLPVGAAVAGLGALLLGFSFVPGRRSGSVRVPASFAKAVSERREERALEPTKASAVAGTLFAKKRKALEQMWAQRPKACSYCDAAMPHEPAGAVVHVTLLKAAPTDVKTTKRIVLAEGWRFEPPEKVTCAACGHAMQGS